MMRRAMELLGRPIMKRIITQEHSNSVKNDKKWVLIVLHLKKELWQLCLICIARQYNSGAINLINHVIYSLLFGKYTSEDITLFLWVIDHWIQ